MYHRFVMRLSIMLVIITSVAHAACKFAQQPFGLTYYTIRSQGANQARHLSGTVNQMYPYRNTCWYGTANITPEYTRTFDSKSITQSLFGVLLNADDALVISGSHVPTRSERDLLADYFYLPDDFQSVVTFNPIIDNIIIDINLFFALNAWCDGLYLNIFAPFVHSRWDLGICERIINPGNALEGYEAGYFTPAVTPRNRLNQSFTQYVNGISSTPINQTLTPGGDFSIVLQPLRASLMSDRRRSTSRLADIRAQLGWMFVYSDTYECGIYAHTAMPTGNRPEGTLFFEPMAGNGHHWELGGGIYGRYRAYCNQDEYTFIDIQWDGYVTTLFGTRQRRCFDLTRGPGSRYMLAQRISSPVNDNLSAGASAVAAEPVTEQFKLDYVPVANLTTFIVDVNTKIAAEWTAILVVTWNCITGNIGYNGYWRSCDHINIRSGINQIEANGYWALKGDAAMFGFLAAGDATLPQNTPVALSATDNRATIHSGNNFPVGTTDFAPGQRNPNIDNPAFAFAGTTPTPLLYAINVANIPANQINTSFPPKLLTLNDIALTAGQTSFLSHKFFGHVQYSFARRGMWQPYIGIGGEVEKGSSPPICENSGCKCCHRVSASQWGIWFKGGLTFN